MNGVGWERGDRDSEESLAGESEAQGSAPSGWAPEEPLRPLERRAKIVTGFLALGIVMDLVAVVSGLMERSLLADVADGGLITAADANSNDIRQLTVGAVQGGVFTLTAVAFLFWFSRAYRNLRALGAGGLRYGHGWAVGAWFVPILNIWRPKQIANDIWRASDPDLPPQARLDWEGEPVPILFLAWWLSYLATGFLYSGSSRLAIRADTLDELQEMNTLFLVADLVSILAGVLALVVVRRTTRRQSARAARLGVAPEDDPTPLWRRRAAWAAVLATVLGFGLQAALAAGSWSGTFDTGPQESAPAPQPPAGTSAGALLADDFSREGVWLLRNERAVTLDYVDGSYRMLMKGQSLWTSGLALPAQADSLSVEADATLYAGNVRTDFYGVACLTSSGVSYIFGISPDGYHTIGFDPGGDQVFELNRLLEDWAPRRFGPDRGTLRIHAECAPRGEEIVLELTVNDTQVAQTSHRASLGDVAGVELFAYSERGGTDVRFDNLVVRDASPR